MMNHPTGKKTPTKRKLPGFYDQVVSKHGRAGPKKPVAVRHDFRVTTALYQIFDVYIPNALSRKGATKLFIERVTSIDKGATIYKGGVGLWENHPEKSEVLRVCIRVVEADGSIRFDQHNLRGMFRNTAELLLRDLTERHGHFEEAIFFNDWVAYGSMISHLSPVVHPSSPPPKRPMKQKRSHSPKVRRIKH